MGSKGLVRRVAFVSITGCIALFVSIAALASITNISILLNNAAGGTTVGPNESVSVAASADVAFDGSAPNRWRSTVVAFDGATQCSNVPDITPPDATPVPSGVVNLGSITSPAADGNYLVGVTLCSGVCLTDPDTPCGGATIVETVTLTVAGGTPPSAEAIPVLGLPGLALLAAAMAGLGLAGFRRRD